VIDLSVSEEKQPIISKVLVKQKGDKFAIPVESIDIKDDRFILKHTQVNKIPYDERDFYLAEDLLDKQVIDINGRRLVRVNDIILKNNGELKVEGIDIGMSGILRRLGLQLDSMRTITLPWSLIEAFDYQTGNIKLKLTQSKLNTFHPAEIAEILEEAGAKERVGLVEALDAKQAASAIAKTDTETQTAILEQVPSSSLKKILARMQSSTLADVVQHLNPFASKRLFNSLETDKATHVKKLLIFEDDEAGGLMDFSFYKERGEKTVGETLASLAENDIRPEIIVIVDEEGKIQGGVHIKNLVNANVDTPLNTLIKKHVYVFEDAHFSQIFKLFAEYNLRVLPVVDKEKKVVGIINIESILSRIQHEEEKEDAF
jgi:CBS domain-containing protein